MPRFVVLLRAVNVGAANRLPMAALREALADAGLDGVQTHIQSGNVLLTRPGGAAGAEDLLEDVVERTFGLDVVAIARSATRLAAISRTNPFPTDGVDPKTLHVAFLKRRPSATAARALGEIAYGREEHALRGTELYLRYPEGVGRAKTTGALLERVLATPLTMRNWNVVSTLASLARGS